MVMLVDLGTKHGDAITQFRQRAGRTVLSAKAVAQCKPHRCVGYERPEAAGYRERVEKQGYGFAIADLSDPVQLELLPTADIYLAWHFLEHLPDKEAAARVVHAALTRARRLAWFRLPSFEQDEDTGEGALRAIGLRFSWTHWRGHPTPWLVSDCVAAIKSWSTVNPDRLFDLTITPAAKIRHTHNVRVVPIDAPIDTNYYSPELGKKRAKAFTPGIVSEWEVIMRFK